MYESFKHAYRFECSSHGRVFDVVEASLWLLLFDDHCFKNCVRGPGTPSFRTYVSLWQGGVYQCHHGSDDLAMTLSKGFGMKARSENSEKEKKKEKRNIGLM